MLFVALRHSLINRVHGRLQEIKQLEENGYSDGIARYSEGLTYFYCDTHEEGQLDIWHTKKYKAPEHLPGDWKFLALAKDGHIIHDDSLEVAEAIDS